MTTFFVDLENGSDAADGTSFANRWKTLSTGASAARIAPGDEIRIMASQTPTSIGNALWTKKIIDENMPSTVSISVVSNTTPIQITTSAVHGLATGDVAQITGQTGNRYVNGLWQVTVVDTTNFTLDGSVAAGTGGTATGTVRLYTTRAIKLSTACNKKIDMCEVAWTAEANVTSSISTTNKQGDSAQSIAIAAGFTTGKAAYRTLPTSIDLSGYEQVTFWIRTNANIAASTLSLRLCSDSIGDTTVDTIAIPAITGVNSYIPITVDTGGALGSAIASIALYADLDPGTVTVLLDCIVAVKNDSSADSLGLQSLISKNTAGETFYPLASIEDTILALDCGKDWSCGSNRHMGWWGTTETVETFKVEPISLAMVTSGDIGLVIQDSGTNGNLISFSGGWNRTDMTTQTGFTWIDCRNGLSQGIVWSSRSFILLENIGIVRAGALAGFGDSGITDSTLTNLHSTGCNGPGFFFGGHSRLTASNLFACNNYTTGIFVGRSNNNSYDQVWGNAFKKVNCNGGQRVSGSNAGIGLTATRTSIGIIQEMCGNWGGGALQCPASSSQITIDEIANISDNQHAIKVGNSHITIHKITSCDGNNIIFEISGQNRGLRIHQMTSSNNNQVFNASSGSQNGSSSFARIRRFISTDVTINSLTASGDIRAAVDRWGDVADDHRIFTPGCDIQSESSVRHTASGIAWRFAPTSTLLVTSDWPRELPITQIFVEANKLVTVKAWVRRTHTDLTIGIRAPRSQLTGMTSDQIATISAAADTWEELTISFTPTESGVVEIEAFAYGGTTHFGYIDDMTITREDGPTQTITLDNSWFGQPFPDMPSEVGGSTTLLQSIFESIIRKADF